MKRSLLIGFTAIFLLSLFSCIAKGRSSGDWAGTYTGVIPSAGGEGINVKVTLNSDETYTVENQYIGKSDEVFTGIGTFIWNSKKDTILLANGGRDDFPLSYKLGKNTLTHLDIEGKVITGEFADMYVLHKQ